MTAELFYFSGTGNSLFVARELSDRLPNCRLSPMVKSLNEDTCITEADIVGFIFPVHALSLPIIVKKFIEKVDIESTKYVFAVATRGGTSFHGFRKIDEILKKRKHELNARFTINMVLNDARNQIFSVPDKETLDRMEKDETVKIDDIAAKVLRSEKVDEPDTMITIKSANSRIASFLLERLVLFGMSLAEKTRGVDYFYCNDKCNGCGVCQRVCLSGKITIDRDRPMWNKDVFCHMCYACINFCPHHAIQIRDIPYVRSFTNINGRYHHPAARISDMQAQK